MIFTFIFAFSVQGAWPANSDLENKQVAEVATMSSASSIISTASSAFSSASATRRLTHLPELVPLSERQEEPRCSVAIQNNTGQFEQDLSRNLDLIYCYTCLWPFLEKKRLLRTNFSISCARVHNVVHIVFLTYKPKLFGAKGQHVSPQILTHSNPPSIPIILATLEEGLRTRILYPLQRKLSKSNLVQR